MQMAALFCVKKAPGLLKKRGAFQKRAARGFPAARIHHFFTRSIVYNPKLHSESLGFSLFHHSSNASNKKPTICACSSHALTSSI